TEMGLAKLYRVTGNEKYLTLAKFMLDERGPDSGGKTNPRGLTYNQAQQRVIDQTEAVGHAVRATYMYSGMADVAAMTGDQSYGQHARSPWFGVACCPGNITRFLASVPGYLYAQQGTTLYVNLFAGGTADIALGDRDVKIVQATKYPWDGAVKMTVTPDRPS